MSKGAGIRVERCIYRHLNGRYEVQVRLNTSYKYGRFDTLEEAREFRDRIVASRPKPVKAVKGEAARALIQSSSRSTREVGGRVFTVVHLPDGPYEPTKWRDLPPLRQAAA